MDTLIQNADHFVRQSLEIINTNKWDSNDLACDHIKALVRLNGYCAMLSQTIMQMLLNGVVWECEIMIRAVSEGSIKLLYVCGKPDETKAKASEYQDELIDYAYSKDSDRAAFYSENVAFVPAVQAHIYSSMGAHKVAFDKTRKERKSVEQKWSHLEMLKEIESMNLPGLGSITALSFGYVFLVISFMLTMPQ